MNALFEEGALVRNGTVKAARPLTQLRLPPSVQGILASRIDRQPSEHKELLQTLAVIGRESSLRLLSQVVSRSDAQIEPLLANLQTGEFIYQQPVATGTGYIFKHALTQEVAYNSLLIEHRKHIHERVGLALESSFVGQIDDHLTQLAYHFSHSNNVAKAMEYQGRAGQQAMQRCSYADAIKYVSDALERMNPLPDNMDRAGQEVPLQLTLGASLMATKGWAAPEVAEAFSRAEELCRRMGEVPQLIPVLYGIWGFFGVRGELERARQIGTQLLTLAETTQDPAFAIAAHYALGVILYWIGDLEGSEQHLTELMRHYTVSQHRAITALFGADLGIVGTCYSASGLWLLGYPDRALERSDNAVQIARTVAHPESLAWTLLGNSIIHQHRRETRQSRIVTEELFSVCEANGLVMQPALAKLIHGWALAVEGNATDGITEIREAFKAFNAPGLVLMEGQGHALLAEAYRLAGDAEHGLLSLTEPLTRTKSEEGNFTAELFRMQGELLQLRGSKDRHDIDTEAEGLFRQAIAIARDQHAKSLELSAITSLARLLAKVARREEARTC